MLHASENEGSGLQDSFQITSLEGLGGHSQDRMPQ